MGPLVGIAPIASHLVASVRGATRRGAGVLVHVAGLSPAGLGFYRTAAWRLLVCVLVFRDSGPAGRQCKTIVLVDGPI